MPETDVVKVMKEWKRGKRLTKAVDESNLTHGELGDLIKDTMAAVKKRIEVNVRGETNQEWALRMGYKIAGLEAAVGRLAKQVEQQNEFFMSMAHALDRFVSANHPGRFSEGLKVVE